MSRFARHVTGFALLTLAFAAIAWRWFPEAQPLLAVDNRLTPPHAEAAARAFLEAHALAPDSAARAASRFDHRDERQLYLELEGEAAASVQAELRADDVPIFEWDVRFFVPGDPRDLFVTLAPSGRVVSFSRTLAETDGRPALDSVDAHALAVAVRDTWLPSPGASWELAAVSSERVPQSGRLDRTFSFDRTDRRFGDATIRLDVLIQGNEAGGAFLRTVIPGAFQRRYGELRAANEWYASLASTALPFLLGACLVLLWRGARVQQVRWRPALIMAGIVSALQVAAAFNAIGNSWFEYDTADSATVHLAFQLVLAVGIGAFAVGALTLIFAAGEYVTRLAFPQHCDWWRTVRDAGSEPVALRVLGAYPLAAFGLAYVSLFYLAAQRLLGWWSPASLLDDPNLIATPLPWVSALSSALLAGTWEEVIFRAVPLALLALCVGDRPARPWVLGAGVVATALIFGFAHANYPSVPAHARGVELFAESVLWGVLFLRVGLPTTVVAHTLYDLSLFGLFSAAGSAPAYRIALAAVVLAGLAPALVVAWQRRRFAAGPTAIAMRFADVRQRPVGGPAVGNADQAARKVDASTSTRTDGAVVVQALIPASRRRGFVLAALGVAALLATLTQSARTPGFRLSSAEIARRADSAFVTLGGDPTAGWRQLSATTSDAFLGLPTHFDVFVERHDIESTVRDTLGAIWQPASAWQVRYVRTDGELETRAESWRLWLRGDGRPLAWRHVLPDSATRAPVSRDEARTAAVRALAALGVPAEALRDVSASEERRPNRLDIGFLFDDTRLRLPDGASARWSVVVAGGDVVDVRPAGYLPEAYERTRQSFDTVRVVVVGGLLLLTIVTVVLGLVRWLRTPALTFDPPPWGTRKLALVAGLLLLASIDAANGWTASLIDYVTEEPWSTFRSATLLSTVLSPLLGVGVMVGLVALADAARRRVPIPSWTDRVTTWAGALPLAGVFLLVAHVPGVVVSRQTGPAFTSADALVPQLALVGDAVLDPLLKAGGALLVLAAVRGRLAALPLLLLGGAILAPETDGLPAFAAAALGMAAGLAVLVVVARPFLRLSTTTWLLAALLATAAGDMLLLTRAESAEAVVALTLQLLLRLAAIVVVHRVAPVASRTGTPEVLPSAA
ncbi:MAG: CPBP family intramembrane metalloprotease [Gemmatimonadaceae bacterium]|nr:CPBP family intramembrane metalloprotease [Gemmatimonadaceae bacterium]